MTTATVIGERVRMLRLAHGMSQIDLAGELHGLANGNALISRVESGRQVVDDYLLASLANALRCQPAFLMARAVEPLATRPLLRAYADAPARAVDQAHGDNLVVEETIKRLKLKRLPDLLPTFDGDANSDHDLEVYAEDVRVAAAIPEGAVVGNVMRAADRLWFVVLPMPGELGRHLGMSQRIDSVGYIRVSRPGIDGLGVPGDRQRFTVAHEIGHLGIHADSSPPDSADDARRIERQAHRFASAFLAPADPLLEDWTRLGGKVTLSVLAELKAVWGISIKALVVLFQQLGIVEDDQATSLYKQISKRGWNKVEPVETTNEAPVWLTRALETKYGSPGTLQLAEGDALLAESYLQTWIDWSPLAKPGHVLDMPQRRKAGVVTDGRAAPVLPLNGRRGR